MKFYLSDKLCITFITTAHSCRSVALRLKKKNGWDYVGTTVPPIEIIVYLLRTKMCASFGQINLNYTQILWKQLVPLNSSCNLLLICHSTWVVLHICRFWNYQIEKSSSKFDYTVTQFVLSYIAACPSISMKMQHYNRIKSYFQRKG